MKRSHCRILTLSSCNTREFTCNDGSCVTMEERCDGKTQCQDLSDEDECYLFSTFSGYKKFLVPPPIGNESTLIMNLSIIINEIIAIDENNGNFEVKMTIIRRWFNPQLTYNNLKRISTKNIMAEEENTKMWEPWTIFQNIKNDKSYDKTSKRHIITVIPNEDYKFTLDGSNKHNTMLFKGAENAINSEKEYSVNWVCQYNMRWYPFDSQRCTMEFFNVEDSITLIPSSVNYSGPTELTQHFVKGVHICSFNIQNRPGVIVEVILGRPLFGTSLSVYMPTLILLILSQLVRVFNKDYLDMAIEVNLTLLLVLATL